MRPGPAPLTVGLKLPPLPLSYRGALLRAREELGPWSGASGPFWHRPAGVLRPDTPEDVAVAVSWAAEHGVALIPRGGGTGMPGGNVGPGVVLDLTALEWIGGPETAPDGTPVLRAQAGAVAAALQARARAKGFELPALPSSARWCTLGGMLACNAAGARSFRHGAARSWVREVSWVRADGSVERLGGGAPPSPEWMDLASDLHRALPTPLPWPDVRKNSSGYALDRFLLHGDPLELSVGSEGTLGVVTEAILELSHPPEARGVALVGVPTLRFLQEAALAATEIPEMEACEYFGRRLAEFGRLADDAMLAGLSMGEGLLLMEVGGTTDQVERALRQVAGLARGTGVVAARDPEGMAALWEFRHAASPTVASALSRGRRSTQFIEDSVVPVTALADYVGGLQDILARHGTDAVLFGHAGDGNLHVNPLVDLHAPAWRDRVRDILEETVALVASLGGTLAGEHGDGRLRTPYLDRFFHPAVVSAFARIKTALDPRGILNPGVKVPIPGADPLAGLGEAPGFAGGSQGPEARP